MIKIICKTTLILCGLLLLSSCKKTKNIKPDSETLSWNQIKEWSFKGKMAINNGQKSGSGRVRWHQSKEELNASFKAPLGQGSWSIREFEAHAELTSSVNGSANSSNAEVLIANELGWYFPWQKMKYWIRGYNSNTPSLAPHFTLTESINDSGWEIQIQQWTETQAGWLPKKIKAIKPPYSVKVIIYDWELK